MPEVSTALTVHDMSRWPPEHRLRRTSRAERDALLREDGWLRFTLVRDPATRLWSAWQSKLLLREPRFVDAFGEAPWFPRIPSAAGDLVEDFRRFVAAVGRGEATDVHWAVQRDLIAGSRSPTSAASSGSPTRSPHSTRMSATAPAGAPRENRSPLALAAARLRRRRRDRAARPLRRRPRDVRLRARAARRRRRRMGGARRRAAPVLRATIDQHARLGRLHAVAQRRGRRAEAAEEKLAAAARRQVGNARAPVDRQPRAGGRLRGPLGLGGRRDRARLHRRRAREGRGAHAPVVAPAAAARGAPGRADRQRLDRRHAGRRAGGRGGARRRRPARGPRLPVHRRALRRRAPRHPGRLGPQPRPFLQLVVRARPDRLRAQVGRRHGASPTTRSACCATSPGSSRRARRS